MKDLKRPNNKKYQDTGNNAVQSLVPPNTKNILDVGCGSGDNARALTQLGYVVDGITISEDELSIAKSFCRNIYLKNLEEGLPEEIKFNKYDVIICSHVLEHIAYPEKLLQDILNILIPNKSLFIIAIPNFLNYKNRLKLLIGKIEYESSGVMDYTHLRWYTIKSADHILRQFGYDISKTIVDSTIPMASYLKFLPNSIKNLMVKILIKISPGLFGSQFIYCCKNKNVNR
jgi:2-polyprenyl-3-methyl-5-hydroxy-6-metoxy-1,4-benzoquinol methylase